jgi:hypothetical protein
MQVFKMFYFYIYVLPLEFQLSREGVEMPFTGLTLPHFRACPQPGPGLPSSHVMVLLCSVSSVKMSGLKNTFWTSF